MALNNKQKFADTDFDSIKESLISYLQGQDKFKDYDYSGSNMSVLIDLLSYNTFLNNYYTNQAMSEMWIDSVQFRDNIMSHSKELNYLPRSRRSTYADVLVEIFPATTTPSVITFPARESFTVVVSSGSDFTFSLRDSVNITPVNGRYYETLRLYEGDWIDEFFTVTGDADERFVLSNKNIDTSSIKLYVRENENATTEVEYTYKNDVYGVDEDDTVYYIQPYIDDKYEIVFGENNFGKQPDINNVVRVEYQVSKADESNGAKAFTFSGTLDFGDTYTVSAKNIVAGQGGSERESIESIRFNAPKSIQIQNRAVTETDYKNLITANFPEVTTVSVYGGEKVFPPQYGRVFVAIDTDAFNGVSTGTKEAIEAFLLDRSVIAIEPIVIDAKFMYVEVTSEVTYNLNKTSKSASNIQNLVKSTILEYSNNNLEIFGKDFRYSAMVKAIDDTDDSIISNDTSVRGRIEITPEKKQRSYFQLEFSNELNPDRTGITVTNKSTEFLTNYVPCVVTGDFYYTYLDTVDGVLKSVSNLVYIQDDGNGQLDIVRLDDSDNEIKLIQKDVGSVDYDTGTVIIRYLNIDDYEYDSISVFANIKTKDFTAPVDRILFIEDTINNKANVKVTPKGIRV